MDNTLNSDIYIGGNELVFIKSTDGQQFSGGGFSVPAIMMKGGMSPININNLQLGGGADKVSNLFEHLAVPNWATTYPMHGGEYKDEKPKHKVSDTDSDSDSDSDIDDDLHDRLLELVKEHENKIKLKHKKTRRKRKESKESKKNTTKKDNKSKK